jgi:hypothetical protein
MVVQTNFGPSREYAPAAHPIKFETQPTPARLLLRARARSGLFITPLAASRRNILLATPLKWQAFPILPSRSRSDANKTLPEIPVSGTAIALNPQPLKMSSFAVIGRGSEPVKTRHSRVSKGFICFPMASTGQPVQIPRLLLTDLSGLNALISFSRAGVRAC